MVCTFFGHRDTPTKVAPLIRELLIFLIEKRGVSRFLVGNNGKFDSIVYKQLTELSEIYPISYSIVYAYMPSKDKAKVDSYLHSILPDGIEKVPARFAICHRNRWMLKQSDIVVVYVSHPSSGASRFKYVAESQGKEVINLFDISEKR